MMSITVYSGEQDKEVMLILLPNEQAPFLEMLNSNKNVVFEFLCRKKYFKINNFCTRHFNFETALSLFFSYADQLFYLF